MKMRAELANLNHCAVLFLSRAAVNLSWYDSILYVYVSTNNVKSIGSQWNMRRDAAISNDMLDEIPTPLSEPCKDIEVL